jgi:hypothetical protein
MDNYYQGNASGSQSYYHDVSYTPGIDLTEPLNDTTDNHSQQPYEQVCKSVVIVIYFVMYTTKRGCCISGK